MNKLMGFFELNDMNIPSIPWKRYTGEEKLDNRYLWTIRSAVYRGDDMNLPRSVGKNAVESKIFADQLLKRIGDKGIVIYYPYFIACKSGTLEVKNNATIIEAVKDDLWNLVTYSKREVTIVSYANGIQEVNGKCDFLDETELKLLHKYVPEIKRIFKDDLLEGGSALLEWSFAFSCNEEKELLDDKHLVFYEARTIK